MFHPLQSQCVFHFASSMSSITLRHPLKYHNGTSTPLPLLPHRRSADDRIHRNLNLRCHSKSINCHNFCVHLYDRRIVETSYPYMVMFLYKKTGSAEAPSRRYSTGGRTTSHPVVGRHSLGRSVLRIAAARSMLTTGVLVVAAGRLSWTIPTIERGTTANVRGKNERPTRVTRAKVDVGWISVMRVIMSNITAME